MSIKGAGELREARGRRKKPIKFKVEFTLLQLKAMSLGLETLIFSAIGFRQDSLESAQGAQDELKRYLRKFDVLTPSDQRFFKPNKPAACARCAVVKVREHGQICDECLSPGAA